MLSVTEMKQRLEKAYFAIYNVGIRQIDPKNYELINFECFE